MILSIKDLEGDMFNAKVNDDISPERLERQRNEYIKFIKREGVWELLANTSMAKHGNTRIPALALSAIITPVMSTTSWLIPLLKQSIASSASVARSIDTIQARITATAQCCCRFAFWDMLEPQDIASEPLAVNCEAHL